MSQTEPITTEHGRIEYETVDCDSCGAEVAKKDADQFFVVHDLRGKKSKYGGDYWAIRANDHTEGWICPYCADSGPLDVPDKDPRQYPLGIILWATFSDRPTDAVLKLAMFATAAVMILLALDASGLL